MSNSTELAPTRRTVIGLSLIAAVGLTGLLLQDRVPPLDRWIAEHVYAPDGNLATVATAISGVGTIVSLCVMLAAVGVAVRRRRQTAVLLISTSRLILGEPYLIDIVAAITATAGVGLLTSTALRLPPATTPAGLPMQT